MDESLNRKLHVSGLERVGYEEAYERQQKLVEKCLESEGRDNFLMLVEHPPVITVGRSGEVSDVLADNERLRERGVDVVETNRGGKATFHGPGQLVVYPIIDLRSRGRDLHRYLRDLEDWLVSLLAEYDIQAEGKSSHTGVWVDGDKIASIGIAVRRWISYHGVALNVINDMTFFNLIVPCGLPDIRMISMEYLVDRELGLSIVADRAADRFADTFDFEDVVVND
jgi:lipoate-protein ligase B